MFKVNNEAALKFAAQISYKSERRNNELCCDLFTHFRNLWHRIFDLSLTSHIGLNGFNSFLLRAWLIRLVRDERHKYPPAGRIDELWYAHFVGFVMFLHILIGRSCRIQTQSTNKLYRTSLYTLQLAYKLGGGVSTQVLH